MPHPNNKQVKNRNPIISKQDYHLTEPLTIRAKKKGGGERTFSTKAQEQVTPNRSLYKPLDQPYSARAETKRKLTSKPEKRRSKNTLNWGGGEKMQRSIAQMKEQTRNTQHQLNKEVTGKLPEK